MVKKKTIEEAKFEGGKLWTRLIDTKGEREEEIKKKGSTDPLTEGTITRLDKAIQKEKKEIKMSVEEKERKNLIEYIIKKENPKEKKSFSESTNPDGGYLLEDNTTKIINTIISGSLMQQLATKFTIKKGFSIKFATQLDTFEVKWPESHHAETETTTGQFRNLVLDVWHMQAQPKAEQRLLEDYPELLNHMIERVGAAFRDTEEKVFINGTGIGQPKGLLQYSPSEINQTTTGFHDNFGQFDMTSIDEVYRQIRREFRGNCSMIMHPEVALRIRVLSSAGGGAGSGGYAATMGLDPDTFHGMKMYESEHMPPHISGSVALVIGDFKRAYAYVERQEIRLEKDHLTEKPYTKFNFTKRIGGAVVNYDALRILKFGA